MKIDVVIPNYNGSDLIKKNLSRVLESVTKYESNIIIVDDGSSNDDYALLESYINSLDSKDINLIRHERNLGFSSAVNTSVKNSDAEFVVLLNSDVSPSKNLLDNIGESFDETPNLFGIGFMDKSIEGKEIVLRGRGIAYWKKGFLMHKRGEVDAQDTFWISGGSSIIKRELFKRIGMLDTLYNPFYWEDIDLSYRACKSGYEIKFDPSRVVEHRHHEGSIKKNIKKSRVKTIAYRNQIIFVWKNITDFTLVINHLIWLPYHIVNSIISFDISFLHGLVLAVLKLPAIINKRSKQSNLYTKKDLDVIKS